MRRIIYLILIYIILFNSTTFIAAQGLSLVKLNSTGDSQIKDKVNWAEFLSHHDLVFVKMPDSWQNAPFTGNGQLGAMLWAPDSGNGLRWNINRADVTISGNGTTEMWGGPQRSPIGDLVLRTIGKVQSCKMRQDLWNAEVTGTIITDKGKIEFSTYTHTEQMVQVIDLVASGGETDCYFEWICPDFETCSFWNKTLYLAGKGPKCPLPLITKEANRDIVVQSLNADGEFAVARSMITHRKGSKTLFLDVGYSLTAGQAKLEAIDAVKKAEATGLVKLRVDHRLWWHNYYPASFISIPDARQESFYWIQMYRLASSTRADRVPMDNLGGPWYPLGPMPWFHMHWDLNIQLIYFPMMGANRLDMGESLFRLLDNNVDNLIKNTGEFSSNSAGIGVETGYNCVSGGKEDKDYPFHSCWLGTLPWAMHNYWIFYRHNMDDQRLRDKLFPLLKRSINLYIHHLRIGNDSMLHIIKGISPEYDYDYHEDCNFDLALLRWGCQTLLEICNRLSINDPLIPKWKEILEKLTPYPVNENGLMVAANLPFAKTHRHYSHLLAFYPLYVLNPENPADSALLSKTLKHWTGLFKGGDECGYSNTGAASMYASLGCGDEAIKWLNRYVEITSNAMQNSAGNPISEGVFSAAQSLQDMLFTSWGGKIRIFPGTPTIWKDVIIHNVRTEGAFLLSAERKNGVTKWVRIKSLAGEKCRIVPSLNGEVKVTDQRVKITNLGNGVYELKIPKGEEAILYSDEFVPELVVKSVRSDSLNYNSWGLVK